MANVFSWFPLLFMAAIFVAVHTDGQSKVGFHFQSCLLANTALNWLFISLMEPDSSYARLFVNSVLHIYCCKTNFITH